MADVTVFHNPACSTSRHAMERVDRLGLTVDVVRYLSEPPDRQGLLELMAKLEDAPADLVRKDSFFSSLGLDPDDYVSPQAVADLLVEHPRLMQRPVLVKGDRAIIGRPKDRVDAFVGSTD
jgi:arsenate reductase